MTTTPEPSPEPESAPAPEPTPAPDPAPEPEPADPVTVVSVDELIDRLVQSGQEEEAIEELPPEEEQLPEEGDQTGDFFTEVDTGPMEIAGMDKLLTYAEAIQQTLDHPALTTSFQDYTVTEGLLLLILLAAFAAACVRILKGGFSWLRW